MITRLTPVKAIAMLVTAVAGFTSCKKEISSSTDTVTSSVTIAVAATETATTSGSTDSVYVIQPCQRGSERVSITEADLPASVTTYLTTNYSGYTFNKAFAIKNSSGVTTAYVAIIFYNNKPVAILFDSNGSFVKVLEQREKGDLDGSGFHDGGRFCDRDGRFRDTVAIGSLPSSILAYMATNYPQDTLVRALQGRNDSSYVVISKNNGLYANVFTNSGSFVRRVAIPAPAGACVSVDQNALPSNVLLYLTTTYPNYVFEKAFAVYKNTVLQGFVVIINANNTKYGVRFDASGNFVAVKTLW